MSLLQMAGGVAMAGVVAAGATALTGSGVTRTGTAADQVVGGTVTQLISGVTVTGVVYAYADVAQAQTNSIAITVAGAAGKYLTVTPTGGSFGGSPIADEWKCTGGVAPILHATAPKVQVAAGGSSTVTCITADSTNSDAAAGYFTGLSSLVMAVTNS